MFKRRDAKEDHSDQRAGWLKAAIETQLAQRPFLAQMLAVANQLRYERQHWSILLPFLLVVFLTVYRRERAKALALARESAK